MKWHVTAADAQTGEERTFLVEAATPADAEAAARQAGFLISHVVPAVQPVASPPPPARPDPLAELAAAASGSTSLPYRPAPASPTPELVVPVPEYWGLRFGSMAFLVFAGLCYLAGLLGLLLSVGMLVNSLNYQTGLGLLGTFAQFLLSLWPIAVGTIFHAASSACLALRDIARNSFAK